MNTVLVVGHTTSSPGACAPDICEFDYNENLAYMIKRQANNTEIVYRDSYSGLPKKINKLKPDLIISLHCNAFNKKASGTETLYYHKSKKSKKFAQEIQDIMVEVLELPDRGIKPKTSEDRGGYLLKNTKAPCVLIEPFFIDNPTDLTVGIYRKQELANRITKWINNKRI